LKFDPDHEIASGEGVATDFENATFAGRLMVEALA
jgi:hypothetical protein